MHVRLSPEVQSALAEKRPIVALESTVISHGLPYPHNLELAREMESLIRAEGATPATIALIEGEIHAGLDDQALERLADARQPVRKISRRDFASALARRELGATTVAATMMAAHAAGIRVFATGGIGGVHRGGADDISADLVELSQTPVLVVCAGAKAILDLPRTLEWLETYGVPVVGYGTVEWPAFYSRESGLTLVERADSPQEVAMLLQQQWEKLALRQGVLLTVPVPSDSAIPQSDIAPMIEQAIHEAEASGIKGKALTPFLLGKLDELTAGRSTQTNLALLKNNGRVAAQVAVALASLG
jgi:pseudouridine-5'-phosphate glycosidase